MRVLDAKTKSAVQAVIDSNRAQLSQFPGFVAVEPGFPIIDGRVHKEPAIIVFVEHKKPPSHLLPEDRAPRQIGPYRVAVMQADPLRQLMNLMGDSPIALSVEDSASGLTYVGLPDDPIDKPFRIAKPMLCHVGPDAGWPVLKPFLEATEQTLTVAMYDFNVDYIATTFIETIRDKDIKAILTWDDSMTAPETTIRARLRNKLGDNLDGWIVRCGGGRRFASAYHEKVAVRDSEAFWLSSGNWSKRSQPEIDPIGDPDSARGMYSKGNREWHIIVEDAALAELFEMYIKHDRDGSEVEANAGEPGVELDQPEPPRLPDLFVPVDQLFDEAEFDVPTPVAPQILPTTPRDVVVLPVLTPDNYSKRVRALIGGARRSIYLQFSYITYSEKEVDRDFTAILEALAELSNRITMDVRIIVGSTGAAEKIRKLVEAGFKETVFRTQSNVHNKGIVVDGETVLVSSTNWSGDGVVRNRDAGLIIHDKEIADYYQSVFLFDWENRANAFLEDDPPVTIAPDGAETPPGMVRMSWREYYG
ncbi:phospholipase D-like domain-containing protein [Bradyrhizobium sp.]|uniref:phospholipase D-like domain-containing protein n=1 Tax=Bradyrhizobium sp. TaxID=376 RepID=UPI000ACD4A32|nr:phospholipase D-like domain-containing protein [Bradyrhizobium sp.]